MMLFGEIVNSFRFCFSIIHTFNYIIPNKLIIFDDGFETKEMYDNLFKNITYHFYENNFSVLNSTTDSINTGTTWVYYEPEVVRASDYYPFGSPMPNRTFSSSDYRYGFGGMEKDDEVKNITGSSYTTEFRQYDPRLGRWLSRDPLAAQFPWQSPYVAFDNNPILKNDPRGDAASKADSDRSRRRKMRKFERVENRMARQTGFRGDELRAAVYDKYADKKFASVTKDNTSGGLDYSPTGDWVDRKNGVTTPQQVTNITTPFSA